MASTMLILLAASRIPELKDRLTPRVLQAATHLKLLERWVYLHGEQSSPSVEQSLRMIGEIGGLIEREYHVDR